MDRLKPKVVLADEQPTIRLCSSIVVTFGCLQRKGDRSNSPSIHMVNEFSSSLMVAFQGNFEPAKLCWRQESTCGRASAAKFELVYIGSNTMNRFQMRVDLGGEKESNVYKNWTA